MAFPSFPLDVVFNILSRLPVKSVVRLQIVCKSWRCMIMSADFIAAHLRESLKPGRGLLLYIPYFCPLESGPNLCTRLSEVTFGKRGKIAFPLKPSSYMFQIVGSINGLVCISELEPTIPELSIYNSTMYVWNPSLGKLKQIGNARMMERLTDRSGVTVYGFGYDSHSNVYKAVRVWYSRVLGNASGYQADEVEIFTLGRHDWKSFKPKTVNTIAGGDSVVHVNGVIHWPASRSMQHEYTCILTFNVRTETFGEIPMPGNYIDGMKLYEENRPIFIGEFKGCLSVAVQCAIAELKNREQLLIWIMKDYGVASSWTKQLKVVLSESVERTIGFTNCEEVLFQKDNGNIICYDTKASKYYRVWKAEDTVFCRVWKSEESLYKMSEVITLSESLVWFDN